MPRPDIESDLKKRKGIKDLQPDQILLLENYQDIIWQNFQQKIADKLISLNKYDTLAGKEIARFSLSSL